MAVSLGIQEEQLRILLEKWRIIVYVEDKRMNKAKWKTRVVNMAGKAFSIKKFCEQKLSSIVIYALESYQQLNGTKLLALMQLN